MIAFVRGELAAVDGDSVIVDVGGVGYRVYVTPNTIARLGPAGKQVKLLTSYQVREDSATLFGFLTREERVMFGRLLGVTGIGAKIAMAVLSQLTASELATAIVTNDANAIARAPGVGKKTAQRVCLELKDKIDNSELAGGVEIRDVEMPGNAASPSADAVQALMSLGYNSAEAAKAVAAAAKGLPGAATEDLIMAALRAMDSNKQRR